MKKGRMNKLLLKILICIAAFMIGFGGYFGANYVLTKQIPREVSKAIDVALEDIIKDAISTVVHVQYENKWQGSGVIISEDGVILTARHVVGKEGGSYIITLSDGRRFATNKACVSKDYDVGYLKVDASNLPTAKFGNSDEMGLGSRLLAIGSPWGKQHFNSVTMGILSADNRDLSSKVPYGWRVLFQTDVAVNPGNSGGPVFNMSGEMVGIVVGLYGPGNYAGISYCIPSNICKSFVRSADLIFSLQGVTSVSGDVFSERLNSLAEEISSVKSTVWGIQWRFDEFERRLNRLERPMGGLSEDRYGEAIKRYFRKR